MRLRPLAFATFLVWRLRIGACGVGACGFWRLWQLPPLFNPRILILFPLWRQRYIYLLRMSIYSPWCSTSQIKARDCILPSMTQKLEETQQIFITALRHVSLGREWLFPPRSVSKETIETKVKYKKWIWWSTPSARSESKNNKTAYLTFTRYLNIFSEFYFSEHETISKWNRKLSFHYLNQPRWPTTSVSMLYLADWAPFQQFLKTVSFALKMFRRGKACR